MSLPPGIGMRVTFESAARIATCVIEISSVDKSVTLSDSESGRHEIFGERAKAIANKVMSLILEAAAADEQRRTVARGIAR